MVIDKSATRYRENKSEILAQSAIYREVSRDRRLARRREL